MSKHVIFDLDGTLLDTEPLYTEAAQALVGRFGATYTLELKQQTMGGDARVNAAFVIEQLDLPLDVDTYLKERNAVLQALFRNVPCMPGAAAFVQNLHDRGTPLAIATSSERKLCELKLAKHPWRSAFSAIVCSDDPEVGRAKPAPDLFLAAARALGAAPQDCLVFEDSPNGIRAARAAGMRVVGLASAFLSRSAYADCDAVVDSFEGLDATGLGL